ncbi:CpaF family protein [Mariniblastus sp.]|nr:CpaF family protein [Mariniblastus sp.]
MIIKVSSPSHRPTLTKIQKDDSFSVGRASKNRIVLASRFIPDEVAKILALDGSLFIEPFSQSVQVLRNNQKLDLNKRHEISRQCKVEIGPFTLSIASDEAVAETPFERIEQLNDEMASLIKSVHALLCERDPVLRENNEQNTHLLARDKQRMNELDAAIEKAAYIEEIIHDETGIQLHQRRDLQTHMAGQCVAKRLIDYVFGADFRAAEKALSHLYESQTIPQFEQTLSRCVEEAIAFLNIEAPLDDVPKASHDKKSQISQRAAKVDSQFHAFWSDSIYAKNADFVEYLAKREVKKQIKDIVFGYGPLEDLLNLKSVTEIMVVSSGKIYVDYQGVNVKSGRRFISDNVTVTIINKIVSPIGRRIDQSDPVVDARLKDGSRVHAIIPPLAVSGPCLTIRRFPEEKLTIGDLVENKSVTASAAKFLESAVVARKNVLISGGTGTGKTTMLNCLSEFIPESERIVTVEDTAELQLKNEHVVQLECRNKNIEGAGEFTIQDLVKSTLRMRPDRIIVGECRGPEALDMLQAMNTGHDGSMTTIHANGPTNVKERLEILVRMGTELPIESIHAQTASAIDLIIHLSRDRSGFRSITHVTEVVEADKACGGIYMKDIFAVDPQTHQLMPTGLLPTFLPELVEKNLVTVEDFLPI